MSVKFQILAFVGIICRDSYSLRFVTIIINQNTLLGPVRTSRLYSEHTCGATQEHFPPAIRAMNGLAGSRVASEVRGHRLSQRITMRAFSALRPCLRIRGRRLPWPWPCVERRCHPWT